MEMVEDVVIVGAGIAGLSTALGLHRLGIRSLVLESSASLRDTGFAFTTWSNAWKALDALGIGDSLREQHKRIDRLVVTSMESGQSGAEISFEGKGTYTGDHEVRCVKRKELLETLLRELPSGTIRYESKVVSIEESGKFKLLHLVDGSIIKTKVLVGCDGVNSVVSKWLGFNKLASSGRHAIRGYAHFRGGHGFSPEFKQFFGTGVRSGLLPCDDTTIYWFFTYWSPSSQETEADDNPAKLKQFVLNYLGNVPDMRVVVESTELDGIISSALRYRYPWEILWGNISKGNVCVAGDALHPMTPDVGQGGCAALEDGVVLARCLGKAWKDNSGEGTKEYDKEEYERIEMELKNYAKERRWRSFELISTAYLVGRIQQSGGVIMNFLRDKVGAKFLGGLLLKKADFDCGKLSIS